MFLTPSPELRVVTGHVGVARPERRARSGLRVVGVAPDAAGVVCEQMDRDRGVGRGRSDSVDVVARRNECVEVAGRERAALDQLQAIVTLRIDLLVLIAAVEANQAQARWS